MADLDKRGSYVPRRTREKRAYQMILGGSGLAVAAVVLFVIGMGGLGFLALILAAVCGLVFWRSVN
ncbi:MAG TPA: hypothetical protein VEX39_17650 [Thermoleophilaceae bacterium]|nr:hypothetical protein [Thermoleophilaceae bacterium]